MWTDGAGPTSSISWLQEGMAGKMQQNFKRQEKNVQSFQKNQRGRSRNMKEKQNLQQKEMSSLIYRSDMIGGICILCSVNQF